MKTRFKYYAICWAIMIILFNVIIFVLPNEWYGFNKFSEAFWPSYIFIMIAFVGQLICSWITFKTENIKKFFYNIPLITVSYSGLTSTLIAGCLCMAIPKIPNWVAIIVCAVILALTAVSIVQAKAAADMVSDIDDKIKVQTFFVKSLTAEAENLMNSTNDNALRNLLKKACEAIRYSDPMSNAALAEDEASIGKKFAEIKNAVVSNDCDLVQKLVEEILVLIDARNKKCKLLK